MKKIIIFGATGSIGVYLTDWFRTELGEQYEIIAAGRKGLSFFNDAGIRTAYVDVCRDEDFARLPDQDVYGIVNLTGVLPAYLKEYDPFMYVDTNIKGSLRIMEYARKVGADRVLYTQTWAEQAGYWGKVEVLSPAMPKKLLYTGDHAFYAIAKSMVTETMEFYHQEYGIKSFVFRLPNVYMYAPNQLYYVDGKERKVAYRYMIEQAAAGKDLEMWGNPDAFKDILYVKDLCRMMSLAMTASVDGGTYNAGTGIRTTLREQIQGIIDVFSPRPEKCRIIEKPEGATFTSFVMDISNAREELGYEPQYLYLDYLKDYRKEREAKRFDEMLMSRSITKSSG